MPTYGHLLDSLLFAKYTFTHRWARLMKQQSPITAYRLPTKEKTSVFRFRLQQTNRSLPIPFPICSKETEVAVFH
jgi:hypothetical protein